MTWTNVVIQGILIGGFYALFACGLSLMFGVLKVINLAHGDIAVVAAYVAVFVTPHLHLPEVWAFLIVVPLFGLIGYLLQRTLIQKSIDRDPFTTLLVTFGLSVVIENLLLEIYTANGQVVNIGSLISKSWQPTSIVYISYVSLTVLGVAVAVLALLQLFLSRTGRAGSSGRSPTTARRRSSVARTTGTSLASPPPSRSPRWRWPASPTG